MLAFDWGVFWAILAALFLQGTYRLVKRAMVGGVSRKPLWDIYFRLQ